MKTESNFKFDANGIEVTIVKKENYTLEDIKQKLINYFYNKSPNALSNAEAEVLKALITHKDITKSNLEMFNGYITEEAKKTNFMKKPNYRI